MADRPGVYLARVDGLHGSSEDCAITESASARAARTSAISLLSSVICRCSAAIAGPRTSGNEELEMRIARALRQQNLEVVGGENGLRQTLFPSSRQCSDVRC